MMFKFELPFQFALVGNLPAVNAGRQRHGSSTRYDDVCTAMESRNLRTATLIS